MSPVDKRERIDVSDEMPKGVAGFFAGWKSVVTGLAITGRIAMKKPVTVRYPAEKVVLSPRWRGALRLRGIMGRDEIPIVRTDEPPSYNGIIEGLHLGERLAPCVGNCPANVDARGQNYLVAENRLVEAHELVRERNVLPGVLGRICHHPCESACRRNYYDQPLAIRPLHRLASEEYAKSGRDGIEKLPVTRAESVAVIGSGPSGLAAAQDLMRLGYAVTMFEKDDKPGGALNSGVPSYRLPREVLHGEIDDLVRMGLDLRCGVEVGRDVKTADLVRDFDAVLLAAGLQISRRLPIAGSDAEGVTGALEFLRGANFKQDAGVTGKRVYVIGGGNVAVDVARCALRVGAAEVRLGCLEAPHEMPCHPWEIEEALDEGVIAMCSMAPDAVLVEDGHVVGMRLRECLSVFDEAGRFAPQYGEATQDIACDVVVFSVGQASDLDAVIENTDLTLSDRGNLVVDGSALTTSAEGVFACGEVVTGPGSAIASIATGHEAATSIHRYLRGEDITADRVARPVPVYPKQQPPSLDGIESYRLRAAMPLAPADERRHDFRQVELGLTHQEGLAEALRCLRCQSEVCVGCTFCARTCPDYAITVERVDEPGMRCLTRYDLDLTKCAFCGLCAEQCPTNALTHTGQYELSFYHRPLMTFDRGEMLRPGDGTRATGRDGIEPGPGPRREGTRL